MFANCNWLKPHTNFGSWWKDVKSKLQTLNFRLLHRVRALLSIKLQEVEYNQILKSWKKNFKLYISILTINTLQAFIKWGFKNEGKAGKRGEKSLKKFNKKWIEFLIAKYSLTQELSFFTSTRVESHLLALHTSSIKSSTSFSNFQRLIVRLGNKRIILVHW